MQRYNNHTFGGAGMYNITVLQVYAYMAEFLTVKIKENEVAFLQVLFIFTFDDGDLIAGNPRDGNAVHLLLQ